MLRRLLPNRFYRSGFLVLLFLLPAFILLTFHQTNAPPSFLLDHPYFQYDLDALEPRDSEQQRCMLPRFHPFHPSIWRFLSPPKPITCKDRKSEWTLLDERGWLTFNESVIQSNGYEIGKSLRCFWSKIERGGATGNMDDEVSYGKQLPLPTDGVKLPDDVEFLRVKCLNFVNIAVYDRLHARIRKTSTVFPIGQSSSRNFVNVVIFGLDSMSRLSFIRHLPLTYKFLTEDLKMTVLRGMNKVGDNTYPNLAALLTGKEAYGGKLPDASSGYDEWPIIWKNFSRLGYSTLWAEDFPDFGLFNYLAAGFHDPPTLHYLRPFWLAIKDSPLLRLSSHMCYGVTPRHMLQVDYLKQFISNYGSKKIPYFGFSFLAELTHEYVSRVSDADAQFLEFFQWLSRNDQLDNTLLIVMSDHGHRFDAIRTSKVGHIEERTPFFAIRLPMTLTSRQPKILDNLLLNSGRLSTPYDVHATLSDLHEFIITGRPLGQSATPPEELGQSLFGQLFANRTCKSASIPPQYCICETVANIGTSDLESRTAALISVQHINNLLRDELDKCSFLTLSNIKTAQLVKTTEDITAAENEKKIRVVFDVEPSLALFEATVNVRGEAGEVWGDVSRINPYAGQSDCIRHAVLRKYCYCVKSEAQSRIKDGIRL